MPRQQKKKDEPDPRLRQLSREDLNAIMHAGHNPDLHFAKNIALQLLAHLDWTKKLQKQVAANSFKARVVAPVEPRMMQVTDMYDFRQLLNAICVVIREGGADDRCHLLFPIYCFEATPLITRAETMLAIGTHLRRLTPRSKGKPEAEEQQQRQGRDEHSAGTPGAAAAEGAPLAAEEGPPPLTVERLVREMETRFDQFDEDHDGCLNRDEFTNLVWSVEDVREHLLIDLAALVRDLRAKDEREAALFNVKRFRRQMRASLMTDTTS